MCPHCEVLHNVFPYEAHAWLADHIQTCPSRPREGDPDEVDQWAVRRFLTNTCGYRRTRALPGDVIAQQKAALDRRRSSARSAFDSGAEDLRVKNPGSHELATQRVPDEVVLRANTYARRLHAVDDVIERLEEGTYGICRECQADISIERLEALPEALLCERCAQAFERQIRSA